MKFKIKNCSECLRFNRQEFCDFHRDKENQPPAITKALKSEKRELWSDRIMVGGFASFCIFGACFLFMALVGLSFWIRVFLLTAFGGLGLFMFRILIDSDKLTRQKIKQLQKKHSEWIIDYE